MKNKRKVKLPPKSEARLGNPNNRDAELQRMAIKQTKGSTKITPPK